MTERIRIKDIQPNAWNKRGDEGVAELATSIAANGLLQPIVVRKVGKKYEIVAGERRWRACGLNKAKEIEATVLEIDESGARAMTLVENMERKRLTPFEEMEELAGLHDIGHDAEQIAAMIGRSESFVRRRLMLTNLKLDLMRGLLETSGSGKGLEECPLLALEMLAAAPDGKQHDAKGWHLESVSAMRAFLLHDELDVSKARWAGKDDLGGIRACANCPQRTGADGSLFPELEMAERDLCLNRACWAEKARLLTLAVADQKRKSGQPVILVGQDFDTPQAREDGVERAADYVVAKKGDAQAVLGVVYDGQEAGKTTWLRRIRQERKDKAPPDRQKWKWIGGKLADKVEALEMKELPDRQTDGRAAVLVVLEDVLRFGVDAQGVGYSVPKDFEAATREIMGLLKPGVKSVLKLLGHMAGSQREDLHAASMAMEVFYGTHAVEEVHRLAGEWDEKHAARK